MQGREAISIRDVGIQSSFQELSDCIGEEGEEGGRGGEGEEEGEKGVGNKNTLIENTNYSSPTCTYM